MKPVLKVPGSMLLKLIYDEPLSTFAFDCNLRRYTVDNNYAIPPAPCPSCGRASRNMPARLWEISQHTGHNWA